MQTFMMKLPLLMLPDIGMLILLVVISVCLIILTLTLRKIWDTFIDKGHVGPPTLNNDDHHHHHHHPYNHYETIVEEERAFFRENVNRGDSGYRTVTFSNAVLQSFVTYNKFVLEPEKNTASKEASTYVKSASTSSAAEEFKIPNFNTNDCQIEQIDADALETNVSEYVAYVGSLIGAESVGKVCLCTDGVNYCNWSSQMFEAFMVDTNFWNVVSVQIFYPDGTLISTSSINAIANSPGTQHALITMSNQAALAALASETEIRIVFKWLDGQILRCIVMKNKIP